MNATTTGIPTPPRAPRRRRRLLAAAFGLVVSFAAAEAGLRLATRPVGRGQERIAFVGLLPWVPPPHEREPFVETSSYLEFDAACGWSPRPLGRSKDGRYAADQHGLRAPAAARREFPADAVRVMLCGDSFAHSDEVPYEDSLGAAVERAVPGTAALVAGVPAYGTDQAWLRWRALKDATRPEVVVIAVHPNDFERNVRLFPSGGEFGTGTLPWSKPRFVLDGGGLRLFNSPPLRGEAIGRLFEDYDATEFAAHDTLHVEGTFEPSVTDGLRTIRFLRSVLAHQRYQARYRARETDPTDEVNVVTRRIVASFAREARAAGAEPVVVALPARAHLALLREGKAWWDATLAAAAAEAACPYVDVARPMSDDLARRGAPLTEPFTRDGGGHYTGAANAFVAETLRPLLETAVAAARARR